MSQRQSCEAVGITPRTLQNWRHAPDGDGRLDRSNFTSPRQIPEDLREQIVDRFCKADVRDLSLTQAFYKLLDENKEYWCSLSTLYRLFRARGLNARRAPTREARRRSKPTAYSAEKPNEVWTWDITYLRSSKYTLGERCNPIQTHVRIGPNIRLTNRFVRTFQTEHYAELDHCWLCTRQ